VAYQYPHRRYLRIKDLPPKLPISPSRRLPWNISNDISISNDSKEPSTTHEEMDVDLEKL
jgi:hypothetical protein